MQIVACPACHQAGLTREGGRFACATCGAGFETGANGTAVLLGPQSPVREWFNPNLPRPKGVGFNARVRQWLEIHRPEERIWTRESRDVIRRTLADARPAEPGRHAVLIGSGLESAYREVLAAHPGVVKVGLAQDGCIDAYCDLCALPLRPASVDLLFSSSVLEHVYDIEKAIAETARVVKPGGEVYAEIPFMRAYHMIPVDYQRYTISGIEALFARHGFQLIEKGICSGPFTAQALYTRDFFVGMTARFRKLQLLLDVMLSWGLHPLKYLDLLCGRSEWAKITACNFYYRGKRV
jgi:SAM-dependent methyltransferase